MLNKHPNCQWFESLWRNGLSAEIQPLTYVHGQYCNNFYTRNKKRSYLISSVRLYKKICTVYSTYTLQAPCSRFSLFRGLSSANFIYICIYNGDVIKWKYFPRYWLFVRWIHRSPVNSPQRPEPRSFDVFFDLCPNKRLSKQAWGWRFETPSRSLLRHSYDISVLLHCLLDSYSVAPARVEQPWRIWRNE